MTTDFWMLLISGAIGAISAYMAAVVKFRNDLRAEYDKSLRDYRILEYRSLWKLTELLPKYAQKKKVTHQDVDLFAVSLRDWYFQCGGIFLSDSCRDAYFELQESIHRALLGDPQSTEGELSESIYEMIRDKCSKLRTAMTRDVGTRKKPVVED